MTTEVSDIGPCKRKIAVSVPVEQVREALQNTWQEARKNVTLKGFRPGKVPKHILEKKFGKAVEEDVKQNLINDAYREALEEHKLTPVRQPEIDSESIALDPDQPLEFELTVEVRPEFEVGEFKGTEVAAPAIGDIKDEQIEQEVERFRAQKAKVEPITEGVAAKGDYLTADVSYQVDGAIVLHHEDVLVDTIQDQIDSIPAAGGTANFAGKEIGATVSTTVKLPDDFEPSGFAAAEATLLSTIKQIRRISLPELDEEFARDVGAESVEDLRSKVETECRRELERQRERFIEEKVFDELIKATPFDLPEELLEHVTSERTRELQLELIRGGIPDAEAKKNVASHADRIRQDQARTLRISFLVDKIAEKDRIFVTEEEMESNIRALATVHNRNSQDVYDEIYESGGLPSLKAQILERKVRKLIRETAKVDDSKLEAADS